MSEMSHRLLFSILTWGTVLNPENATTAFVHTEQAFLFYSFFQDKCSTVYMALR